MAARSRTELKRPLDRLRERIVTGDRGYFFAAIADKVAERRVQMNMSQRELAELCGTTQSSIARLESGATTPTLERISDLVRACGFELTVGMGKHDDDHDWSLVQDNLRLTPTQRIEKIRKAARFARDLQEAGRAARASRT
jgi:transcriptional regulator with XRE-family HTH domain